MYLQDDRHALRPVAHVYANNTARIGHTSDEDIASDRHRQSARGTVYKTVNAAYVQQYTEVAYIQAAFQKRLTTTHAATYSAAPLSVPRTTSRRTLSRG